MEINLFISHSIGSFNIKLSILCNTLHIPCNAPMHVIAGMQIWIIVRVFYALTRVVAFCGFPEALTHVIQSHAHIKSRTTLQNCHTPVRIAQHSRAYAHFSLLVGA